MLTATCPSCSAPITFRHAAALATVCESCSTTVAREGEAVRSIGQVAPFARDLSPLRVGARGAAGDRPFEVIGVLRKVRDRVRWNEWFLAFEDGETGWLSEGNGEWQLFDLPGLPVERDPARLEVGDRLTVGEDGWEVTEAAAASIAAAEGSLPFPVTSSSKVPYVDLRSVDGRRVATLDAADDPPTLWRGRAVRLPALSMEGLRPFAGWSDETEVQLEGPEITGTRSLRCPNCGGSLNLRAPGQANTLHCEYCGSELGVQEEGDASEARLIRAREKQRWSPTLKLGAKGTLDGVRFEIIGAMERCVTAYGTDYPWTEYYLYNPYRGGAFLVEADGHWNLIRRLHELPVGGAGRRTPRRIPFKGYRFRHFQAGLATVRQVLGEFTWEVHRGDRAKTDDWVDPPMMISRERTGDEVAWTYGQYLDPDEVRASFGTVAEPIGVAPNQPNPWKRPGLLVAAVGSMAALIVLTAVAAMLVSSSAAREVIVDASWQVAGETSSEVFLTQPFTLDEAEDRHLHVELDTDLPRSKSQVHVALMNTADGEAWLLGGSNQTNDIDAWVRSATPGAYVARAEVTKASGYTGATRTLKLSVTRDEPFLAHLLLIVLFALMAPVVVLVSRTRFENRRWSQSDYADDH